MTLVWLQVVQLEESTNTTDAVARAQEIGPSAPPPPPPDDGANDILVIGSDSRTDMQGNELSPELLRILRTEATETLNTDTLILLRIPRDGGRSSAVSIPRDTSVMVHALGSEEKINGAFGLVKARTEQELRDGGETDDALIERESDDAGRAALIQAVQGLTGVRVDHYTEVSLYGFYLLTEVIDGVDVCLRQSTSDPDSGASFAAGPQTVRGGDAVAFVRQRKNLPRGDLDRIVRQQTFLASAMNKVLSGDLLTNPGRLDELEEAVAKTVVMDEGLGFLELVQQAQALASGNVRFDTIPVTGVGARNDRGQSIITVDVPAVREYVADLVTGTPPAPAPPAVSTPESTPESTPAGFARGGMLDLSAPAAVKRQVPCVY
ncbi:LCP family protein [Actinophytocola sp. S1-96]|uniref:LCP family protein n=2 Tax=Actinophytocola gossypii TaxID=2812003 RepID=A0ABT2JEC1_9PSEU|nr:LCP family protein [Actinophytocola gossypii]